MYILKGKYIFFKLSANFKAETKNVISKRNAHLLSESKTSYGLMSHQNISINHLFFHNFVDHALQRIKTQMVL